jgi:hypothetical protein
MIDDTGINLLKNEKGIRVFEIFFKDWMSIREASIEYNPIFMSNPEHRGHPTVTRYFNKFKLDYLEEAIITKKKERTSKLGKKHNYPSKVRRWRINLFNVFKNMFTLNDKSESRSKYLPYFRVMFNDEDVRAFLIKLFDDSHGIQSFIDDIVEIVLLYQFNIFLIMEGQIKLKDQTSPDWDNLENKLSDLEDFYERTKDFDNVKNFNILKRIFKTAWNMGNHNHKDIYVTLKKMPLILGSVSEIPGLEDCFDGRKKMMLWMYLIRHQLIDFYEFLPGLKYRIWGDIGSQLKFISEFRKG